jgi:hypothetical protein
MYANGEFDVWGSPAAYGKVTGFYAGQVVIDPTRGAIYLYEVPNWGPGGWGTSTGAPPMKADIQCWWHGFDIHCNDPWAPTRPDKYSVMLDMNTDTGYTAMAVRYPNTPAFLPGSGGPANPANGTTTMGLDAQGNFIIGGPLAIKPSGTLWVNPSDPRLKTDITPYAAGLAALCQTRPITYRLKADRTGTLQYGFDADEVRRVLPECVGTMRAKLDPYDGDGEETDVLTLDMNPMLVALINAIRELADRVQALETRN